MTEVPDKYTPEPRKHDDKDWLREQYWGNLRSMESIAAECGVEDSTIRERLIKFGIPRRPKHHARGNGTPFDGFYDDGFDPDDGPDWRPLLSTRTRD